MQIWLGGVPGGGIGGDCKIERELTKLWQYRLWSYHTLLRFNNDNLDSWKHYIDRAEEDC